MQNLEKRIITMYHLVDILHYYNEFLYSCPNVKMNSLIHFDISVHRQLFQNGLFHFRSYRPGNQNTIYINSSEEKHT